jgi:uncharacterized membrane protein
MMNTPVEFNDPFADYLQLISRGLKHMNEEQRNDVLAEIRSHLADRAEQFRRLGSLKAEQDAVLALGDANTIALQFSLEALGQKASHSFRPWVLLAAASRMAMLGARGLAVFLTGVFGYGLAFGALVAPLFKLFIPQTGTWIGPHEFVLAGVPGNPQAARELAGANFVYFMILLAFLSGTATTFLLRRMVRSLKLSKRVSRASLALPR